MAESRSLFRKFAYQETDRGGMRWKVETLMPVKEIPREDIYEYAKNAR
jgi:hypothetical protein